MRLCRYRVCLSIVTVVTCIILFFSSRRRHTRCALVTGVQTCALPICHFEPHDYSSTIKLAWLTRNTYQEQRCFTFLPAKKFIERFSIRSNRSIRTSTSSYCLQPDCACTDRKSTRLNSSH